MANLQVLVVGFAKQVAKQNCKVFLGFVVWTRFFGLADQGKDIVLRFIREYSSLSLILAPTR